MSQKARVEGVCDGVCMGGRPGSGVGRYIGLYMRTENPAFFVRRFCDQKIVKVRTPQKSKIK